MSGPPDVLHAKILIVDDERVNVVLLENTLRGAGFTSIASTLDPREVLGLHRANRYDLILLDLVMPVMDGFQVMDALAAVETEGYLPVLAVTAEPRHKLRALLGGAKDFIAKPFELAEVLMRVRNMLEVRLLHQASLDHGRRLESMALHDPLTGLANRRLLADRLSTSLLHARKDKSSMAVLCLDLDGFKRVNDTLGHAAGDDLLKAVAARLTETVRVGDTVARLGGDEFAVALWRVNGADQAAAVAAKVVAALSRPYALEGRPVGMSASAGVSVYPADGEDADSLLKSADQALYAAKHGGKNTYRLAVTRARESTL